MFGRYKVLSVYAFAIPLALILGFLAASPGETTFMLIGLLCFFLALPIFITWHHALLIIFWNSALTAYFLPGHPNFWLVFAALSFGLSVLNHIMGRKPFLPVPEMTRPLLFLTAVVLGTAWFRGGIGFEVFAASSRGGKFYINILLAVCGYFALTGSHIPLAKGRRMVSLYFLSQTTSALSNLAYTLGPSFYFLYYLVPANFAAGQAASDYGMASSDRIQGLAPACPAVVCFLLVHYGIRGLCAVTKPWRFAFLLIAMGASCFSGFRSVLVLILLILAFQFYFEGLFRTRYFPILGLSALLGAGLVLGFANKMPLAVQRAVSFLPVNVDTAVRMDAADSVDWRTQMWEVVWKEVPKYLVVGRGYAIDPTDLDAMDQAVHLGLVDSSEESMLTGDYHSGPLSVLVPLGIAGTAAFLWILVAGFSVLHSNLRFGDEKLRKVNTVLLSFYLANCVSYFFIFGAFSGQLAIFLGAVGLSVSLNGGVKRKAVLTDRRRDTVQQPYAVEMR